MTLYKRTLGIVGVGLLLSGTQLFAAQMNAKEVVNKAYAQIGSMDRYAFSAVISDNETIEGKTTTYKQNVSVKIDRPGSLRVDTKGDIKNRSNYLHNGQFTMIDHGFGYYTQLNTPETIGETIDYLCRDINDWFAWTHRLGCHSHIFQFYFLDADYYHVDEYSPGGALSTTA